MGQKILSAGMVDIDVKATCVLHNFLTRRGDNVVASIKLVIIRMMVQASLHAWQIWACTLYILATHCKI